MTFFRFGQSDEEDGLGPPPGPFQFGRREFRIPGGLFRWAAALVLLIVLFIIASIAKGIYADWLWFESVDYVSVYRLRIVTRIWLFFAGAGVFLLFFGGNVLAALRLAARHVDRPVALLGEMEPAAARRIALVVGMAAALFLPVIFGVQAASRWDTVLLFLNSQSIGMEDPQFHKDISFYLFRLPTLNFIVGWSLGLVILTTIVVVGIYAFRLVLGGFSGEAPAMARPHVSLLLVVVLGLFVWRYWLSRFGIVYSERGSAFGASYTDVNAQLPVIYVLMALASLAAILILVSIVRRGLLVLPLGAIGIWVVAGIVGGLIYPATVQRFQVEPNELSLEREFIQRNIDATRFAYGLDGIDERPFPARASGVTAEEIAESPETLRNIRLWDSRPLLQTLDQIQAIRPLYDFRDVDVDRYVIDGEVRQVMLAARELDQNNLPIDARGWVNSRLQFTHGYGLAMVPVNEVIEEGLPRFFVKDIPPTGVIEIDQPRIYYGEQPEHYVIVNSTEEEFDFPLGEERATTIYEGEGGVRLNSFLRRLVYAWELADTNILISDAIVDDSRLLYRRNISERVNEVAPFLLLDSDPYLVIADGQLFWFQDAYTHTDRYPYSTRLGGLNYIRNSVKVVTNAFDGSMTFYLVETENVPLDPIARVYDSIYPDLFTPFAQMPESHREHIRYPEDLFQVQAQLYLRYHIKDVNVFFNREDVWDIPTEIFIDQEQIMEPYYVIMRLPGEEQAEFVLILPFRPANRNNTIAWLAARSDGEQYGKLLAFRFPTETLVFGPLQVEARIDQDTTISQQISLWNQSGSQVIRGNLLMIPIGEGNLFVEPIYLQATQSRLPELKRVVVVNGNNIAMEKTLDRALEVVLGRAQASAPFLGEPDDGPAPTPAATPAEGETPAPTPVPLPTLPPEDIVDLVQDAEDLLGQLEAILNRLRQISESQ